MFLRELNCLDVNAADVGSVYLMAFTKEKLYIIAGPEFGDPQGCLLVIVLYGLQTSAARWHDCFADTLHVWMKDCSTPHYEFICVYVWMTWPGLS
jgi:hypothetical protein